MLAFTSKGTGALFRSRYEQRYGATYVTQITVVACVCVGILSLCALSFTRSERSPVSHPDVR